MHITRVIFWQPFASPHQEAFLEAVAEQFTGEVVLAVERSDLPPERIAQGWRQPVHHRVKVVDVSIPSNHDALARHRNSDSLHVFTGFFSHRLVWAGFHKLKSSQARLAIYSEAPEQPWQTGWLKRLRGRVLARAWSHRVAFVLAVGCVGCKFFERAGFPREKIVPFGYFFAVPSPVGPPPRSPTDDPFRFIAAGQLIHRKGIDILIEACATLPASGWRLAVYGDGPERSVLEQLASRLGLADRITFHGGVSNSKMSDLLQAADCTVVPSRFDGWAAVVNESLAAGTPVICSAACGAAMAVAGDDVRGVVVQAASVPALTAAMQTRLKNKSLGRSRDEVLASARKKLCPIAAAKTFLEACNPRLQAGQGPPCGLRTDSEMLG